MIFRGVCLQLFFFLYFALEVTSWTSWTWFPSAIYAKSQGTSQHLIFFVVNRTKQDIFHRVNSSFPLS